MPHVNITHFPREIGAEERAALAAAITELVITHLGSPPTVISASLRQVDPADWNDVVGPLMADPRNVLRAPGTAA